MLSSRGIGKLTFIAIFRLQPLGCKHRVIQDAVKSFNYERNPPNDDMAHDKLFQGVITSSQDLFNRDPIDSFPLWSVINQIVEIKVWRDWFEGGGWPLRLHRERSRIDNELIALKL